MDDLTRGERLQIMLTREELEALDSWRFSRRMPSRAAAIRELLKRGLAAEGFDHGQGGSKSEDFGVTGKSSPPAASRDRQDAKSHPNRRFRLVPFLPCALAHPLIEGAALGRPGRTCRGSPKCDPGLLLGPCPAGRIAKCPR